MNPSPTGARRRGVAVLATLALSVTGAVAAVPAVAAPSPVDATVTDASLTWGVKESFRNYLTGPIAGGQVTTLGSTSGTGPFTWDGGSGDAAEDASSADVGFGEGNGVHFQGHEMDGGYALDLAFTNPRVVITSPDRGELRMDVAGREFAGTTTVGEEYVLTDVPLAELELSDPEISAEELTWTGVSATLTEQGGEAFGGFYEAGAPLDPVDLTLELAPAAEVDERETAVTVTGATAEEGLTVQVAGENYRDLPTPTSGPDPAGVYAALIDANSVAHDDVSNDTALAVEFIPGGDAARSQISDGAWSAELNVAAADLDAAMNLELIVWVAHGNVTSDTLLFSERLALTADQREALFGPEQPDEEEPGDEGKDPGNDEEEPGDEKPGDEGKDPGNDEEEPGDEKPGDEGKNPGENEKPEDTGETGNEEEPAVPNASVKAKTISLDGDRAQTVTASGFDPNEDVQVTLHSKAVDLGTTQADAQGRVNFTFTVPESIEPGKHKVVLAGLTSGVEVSAAFTVTGKESTVVCTTETVPGTPGNVGLTWGVRSSFVSYVEGGIANGSISTSNGASRSGGTFTWGAGSGSLDDAGAGTVSFPGAVHFTGHDGTLDLRISNLQVKTAGGNSGTLVAFVKSQDMEGNVASNGTVTLANLSFSSLSGDGGTASVSLTAEGAKAFSGFYSAGEAMDDLKLSVSGATGETEVEVCYDADGNRVNPDGTPYTGDDLAATGAGGVGGLAALVGALMLTGAALVITRRNRAEA